ncbi:hypothetical protein WKR88_20545 [Trinickia caryophylli]|uniref:Uncharacterized protein n=2 Tax=Trinickia caryophylli TaxID=28094 RepID=A0A1X7F2J3_TRICW|nr:hypothetical protein [Trinickia caryophylli]PMS10391.1 hypothetical protein C0Z17_20060 [Trinickia caryophylli]WQE13204.1 hypothetical protein U0034_07430 [Trinickia caryophylli]GLU34487.1 hypothetical protein Busp01_43290 [Trinickia caryophylli]SMF44791.1 hypothetical protein SAMN06295900_10781 [Trinickia caryophylli]
MRDWIAKSRGGEQCSHAFSLLTGAGNYHQIARHGWGGWDVLYPNNPFHRFRFVESLMQRRKCPATYQTHRSSAHPVPPILGAIDSIAGD